MKNNFTFKLDKIVLHSQCVRYVTRGKVATSYTTKEYTNFKELIKQEAMNQLHWFHREGEGIALSLTVYYPIPKSRKDLKGGSYKVSSPDLDNISKGILDALNGVVYADDKQICHLGLNKGYHNESEITVYIKTWVLKEVVVYNKSHKGNKEK